MAPGSNSLAVVLRYPEPTTRPDGSDFTPRRRVELAPGRRGRLAISRSGSSARVTSRVGANLPNIAKIPGCRCTPCTRPAVARRDWYASRFGAAYACSEFEQILDDRDIDVVLIVSRNQQHAEQAEAALRAGKHVFLEKPMAFTKLNAGALEQAVRDTGRQLTVGFNRRFAPFYIEQKRVLARRSGPAVLNCRVNSPGLSGTYWAAESAHGGAILGEGCHFVDLLYWLLESEPTWVSGACLPTSVKEPIGDHNVASTIGFADGSVANFTYSTVGSKTSSGERIEGWAPGLGCIVEDFKWFQSRTSTRATKSKWWPEKGYETQMRDFVDSIRTGDAPAVTVRDGARATVVCLRLLESVHDRMPRAVDLDAALA